MYQYDPVNPLNAFAQSFQMVRGIQDDNRARQQAEMEAQAKAQRKRDLQGAIVNLRMNPSPEAIAEFGLQFPEMKEQMDGYFKALSEGKKATQRDAAQQVIMAQRMGGDVAAVLENYAKAAENSGDQATAKEFRDAAAFAKQNPDAAAETARLRLAFTDPDAYKLVYDNSLYDTAKIKEVLAEGKEYGTPEFQARMKELNDRDPLVNVSGVGVFSREQLSQAMMSGQPTVTPMIPEQAVKDLVRNPRTAPQFDEIFGKGQAARILGGGGSDATGSFR